MSTNLQYDPHHFLSRNPHALPFNVPSSKPLSLSSLRRTVAYLELQPNIAATSDAETVACSMALFTAAMNASSEYCSANKWLSFFLGISSKFKHSVLLYVRRISHIIYVHFALTYVDNDKRQLFIRVNVYHVLHTLEVFTHGK